MLNYKRILHITTYLVLYAFLFSTDAFAQGTCASRAGGNVFQHIACKATQTLGDLRGVIYVLGGFGLIAFAFAAIFGKISFKHLAQISASLFLVAMMSPFIEYFTGNGEHTLKYGDFLATKNFNIQGSTEGTGYTTRGEDSAAVKELEERLNSGASGTGYTNRKIAPNAQLEPFNVATWESQVKTSGQATGASNYPNATTPAISVAQWDANARAEGRANSMRNASGIYGAPVGYGLGLGIGTGPEGSYGVGDLFRDVNTGLNTYDSYKNAEKNINTSWDNLGDAIKNKDVGAFGANLQNLAGNTATVSSIADMVTGGSGVIQSGGFFDTVMHAGDAAALTDRNFKQGDALGNEVDGILGTGGAVGGILGGLAAIDTAGATSSNILNNIDANQRANTTNNYNVAAANANAAAANAAAAQAAFNANPNDAILWKQNQDAQAANKAAQEAYDKAAKPYNDMVAADQKAKDEADKKAKEAAEAKLKAEREAAQAERDRVEGR